MILNLKSGSFKAIIPFSWIMSSKLKDFFLFVNCLNLDEKPAKDLNSAYNRRENPLNIHYSKKYDNPVSHTSNN